MPGGSNSGRRWGGDPHRLDVDELADAGGGQLAAVAALLDPAEGKTRVGFDRTVNEHGAGFNARDDLALGGGDIVGPDAGAQAETRGVGEMDRVIDVVGMDQRGDRAEGFIV